MSDTRPEVVHTATMAYSHKPSYTKTVRLIKSDTEIVVHLSRGSYSRVESGKSIDVDGEWGRSGERCGNDYHNYYWICKQDFHAYIGEKLLDGYVIAHVKTDYPLSFARPVNDRSCSTEAHSSTHGGASHV